MTLAVDRNRKVLRPLISWQDARSKLEIKEVLSYFSAEKFYSKTGMPPIPNLLLPKIIWMQKNEPKVYERTEKFVQYQDVVLEAFGADGYFTDFPSMSFYGTWNVRQAGWDESILEQFSLTPSQFGAFEFQ